MRASVLVGLGLTVLLSGPAFAQEKSVEKTSGNWVTGLWPFGGAAKKAAPALGKQYVQPLVDQASIVRAKELAAMQRRQQVCLKLQEIAIATQDDELHRKAEDLAERAWALYLQRTGGPLASTSGLVSDLFILDQPAPQRAGADRAMPREEDR